jgi:hypothetical protein
MVLFLTQFYAAAAAGFECMETTSPSSTSTEAAGAPPRGINEHKSCPPAPAMLPAKVLARSVEPCSTSTLQLISRALVKLLAGKDQSSLLAIPSN